MISKNLGGHLAFQIVLEKQGFHAGETVKGILKVFCHNDFHVRKLRFMVEGTERALRVIPTGLAQADPYRGAGQLDYNIFYSIDLSRYLTEIHVSHSEDGQVVIPGGDKALPFEFSLPEDLPYSYNGVLGGIMYRLVVYADIPYWTDIEQEFRFEVYPKHGVIDMLDKNNPTLSDDLPNEFHTNRIDLDNFIERDPSFFRQTRLDADIVLNGKKKFLVGDKIDGIAIFRNIHGNGIRGLEVTLWGLETTTSRYFLYAGNHASYIRAKYVQRIVLDPERHYEEEAEIKIPFTIRIPVSVSPGYSGKFLQLFWGLESKLDLALGEDPVGATELDIS